MVFLIGLAIEFGKNGRMRDGYLMMIIIYLTIWTGFREGWADEGVYAYAFITAPDIFSFSSLDQVNGYDENGFKLITIFLRTFSDSWVFYFLVMGGITIYLVYRGDKKLSPFPIMGMMVYIARFFLGRNMIQMRAALSYAIILLAVDYVYKRDWKRYFLIVFIAWEFHHSAVIAIPFYFLCNWFHFGKKFIYFGLAAAFLFGIFGQGLAHQFIEDNATDLNISARYTDAGGEKGMSQGLGITNPMIYFQSVLLICYTYLEKQLAPKFKYYYILRTGYFYSTLILIGFCSYLTLSGRTSSLFATFEIAIIPSMIYLIDRRSRQFAAFVLAILITAIFYMNFSRTAPAMVGFQ